MPALPDPTPADLLSCKAWIAHHSRSFYLSSLLLPREVRHASWALYAFCRRADDAVDDPTEGLPADEGAVLRRRIAGLRQRLHRAYGHGPAADGPADDAPEVDAIDRAFAAVAREAQIPQALPERLLRGMQMDAEGTRYRTWDELLDYCFNVASTVGLMMTAVMGTDAAPGRRAEVLCRAADLGLAMQLTNIARDVGEDARRGRVYLPDELLRAHGSSAEEVRALASAGQPPSAGLRAAIAALLDRAEAHYAAADLGIPLLPRRCRLAIRAARLIYAAIGERVAAAGYDSLTRRAVVPTGSKLWLVVRAGVRTLGGGEDGAPALTNGPADPLLRRLCGEVGLLALPPRRGIG